MYFKKSFKFDRELRIFDIIGVKLNSIFSKDL